MYIFYYIRKFSTLSKFYWYTN